MKSCRITFAKYIVGITMSDDANVGLKEPFAILPNQHTNSKFL